MKWGKEVWGRYLRDIVVGIWQQTVYLREETSALDLNVQHLSSFQNFTSP